MLFYRRYAVCLFNIDSIPLQVLINIQRTDMFNANGITKRPKLEVAEIVSAKVKKTDTTGGNGLEGGSEERTEEEVNDTGVEKRSVNVHVGRPEDGTEIIDEDPETNESDTEEAAVVEHSSSTDNETGESETNETATSLDGGAETDQVSGEIESDDVNDTEDSDDTDEDDDDEEGEENEEEQEEDVEEGEGDEDGEDAGENEEEGRRSKKKRTVPFKDLVVFIWKSWKIIVGKHKLICSCSLGPPSVHVDQSL